MIPASESVKLLTSSLKGMKLSANEAISVVDKLTKLDMKSATSAQELAQALSKVANSARLAKVSQDEILGILSVGIETTQQSGDVIGTAVRSLLARFSNVKASKFSGSGEETEGTLNDTEAVLSKIGIRIRNASGEMRSFMDVLDDVAEKWDTLDDVSRNAISTAMAGTRQKEIFASIIENYDRVKELIGESANAAGTADEKYTAYMDSMEAATKRLQNAWEGFTQSLETSTVMKFLTNATAAMVENADKLKYIVTGIAAASSVKLFDFVTNKGETGGWKGLIANIPFIGRGTKTNNILESIDKKVGNIEKGVGADSIANQTKNGGLFKRLGSFLKTGFGRGDIYDPETGKSMSYKDIKYYNLFKGGLEDIDPQKENFAKLLKQRQIGNAAMGATSAVLTNLLTTKQVGGGVGGWIGKFFTGNLGNEQTIEETSEGKALRTIASGGLAALGGAFFGPLGAMLGQTIGEGAASIVSTIVHRSELEMKQRVADAKENLSRLDAIKSTMETNSSIMTEELTSSEDFEKLYKYTDDLYDKLFELQYEGNVNIIGAINNAYETFKGVENITSIRDLCDEINNGNADQRSMIKKQLELAGAQVHLEELQKSQEEEREALGEKLGNKITVALGGNVYVPGSISALEEAGLKAVRYEYTNWGTQREDIYEFSEGTSVEDRVDILNKAIKNIQELQGISEISRQSVINSLKEQIKQIESATQSLKKYDQQIFNAKANVGFLTANIHDLTTTELKDLTMDGVVGLVVKALEDQGIEVRNAAGYIKDEYQDAIEKLIKSDSKFNALQQADTKTLGQLTSVQERFSSMLEEQTELVKKYGKSWDKWYDAAKRGKLSEEIAKIVYAANPERIEQFARAWNTTREGLEKLTKEFPDLTTAIGLMSPSEVREYYSVFTDFFEDLATDSALTAANFEKLINQYPQLLKYYKQGADSFKTSLVKAANEEQMRAYANAILSTQMSSSGISGEFLTALKEDSSSFGEFFKKGSFQTTGGRPVSYDALIKEIGGVKSLNEALDVAAKLKASINALDREKGQLIEDLINKYLDYEQVVEWIDPLYEQAKQAEIDYLQQQIDNLEEQKNALSSVNDERQRELDLIKAKDALENAKQQKRRVYRAGIGFSYEADEEAISSAQENLSNLDIQRQQDDLQYQIDQIELQKQILENLDENKQKEANKQALEEWIGTSKLENIESMTQEERDKFAKWLDEQGMSDLAQKVTAGTSISADIKKLTDEQKAEINRWLTNNNGGYSSVANVVDAIVDGFAKNRISFNTGTGKIKDAEGNVIGQIDGFKGVKESKKEQRTDAATTLSTAVANFNNAYGPDVARNWGTKGTREYTSNVDKYNKAYEYVESALSAAKDAGIESGDDFKAAQNIINGGKEKDVSYKRVDLSVKDMPGFRDREEGTVKLDPSSGTSGNPKDVYNYLNDNIVKKYNSTDGTWENWVSWKDKDKSADDVDNLPDYSIIGNGHSIDEFYFIYGGSLYPIRSMSGEDLHWGKDWATGTLSAPEGVSLINELGTEAVITPGGTLTALPSKTGIVPADITRNVWALGEVAPTLVAQLGSLTQKIPTGNAGNTTYEEGQYFDNFTMNVYPAKGDDFNKILEQARAQMRLTRHNN